MDEGHSCPARSDLRTLQVKRPSQPAAKALYCTEGIEDSTLGLQDKSGMVTRR